MKACQICLSTFDDAVRFCPFHGSELKSLSVHQYLPGETICGYYLKTHIGRDGLGELFCATKGGNVYRFRLYSGALLCDSGRLSRLHSILEKSFQITGGGIPVADFDWLEDGTVYSAHPYIPGRSFHDILSLGLSLNENEIAELLLHLLRAVKDIHTQRIVDGNIALSNVILDNGGRIRLHDVGLWDVLRGEHFSDIREDHPEIFDDIIDLMSPEIARGEDPGFQSDVYSCGAAACCLFRGKLDPGTADVRMKRHFIGDVQGIQLANPAVKITNDFADLLDASMVGSSGVRFQTTRAFITALLSIHPELDENADALSSSLAEKLLCGAEKPVMRSSTDSPYAMTQLDNNAWDNLKKSEESIEVTRRGTDPERTVVEKASWDDLANLVGENLETSAVTDLLDRAVTTEMDPFEASPTQEIPAPSFKLTDSTENESIQNILNSLTSPSLSANESPTPEFDFGSSLSAENILDSLRSELSISDKTAKDIVAESKNSDDQNSKNSDTTEDAADSDKSDDDTITASQSDKDDNAENTNEAQESDNSDDSSEDANEAQKSDNSDDETNSAQNAETSETETIEVATSNTGNHSHKKEKSGKKKKSKSKTDLQKVSDASDTPKVSEVSDAESEKEDSSEKDDLSDPNKPHKRIGRKKTDANDELERGDVISVSNSMEMRRIKRRRRTDFAPQNKVVEADLEIPSMINAADKPEYAAIPWMTTTSGYKKNKAYDNSSSYTHENIGECPTGELPAVSTKETSDTESEERSFFDNKENDDPWFGENESKRQSNQNKKRILLAVIVIMLMLGIGIILVAFFNGKNKVSETPAADVWAARIEQFNTDVAAGTEESLLKARESLKEMRKDGLDREQLKQCHETLKNSYSQKADALRKTLKKSEEIPDPLDIGTTITQLDVNYNTCIAAIDPAAADQAELKQNCETEKSTALNQAQQTAYANAQKLIPELKSQSDGWTKLADLYQTLTDLTKRHPDAQITTNLYESNQEQTRFATRLKTIESEGARLAALNIPAQAPAETVPEAPSNPDNTENANDALAAQNLAAPNTDTPAAPVAPAQIQNTQPVAPVVPAQIQNTQPAKVVAQNTAPAPSTPSETAIKNAIQEPEPPKPTPSPIMFVEDVTPAKQAKVVDDDPGLKIPVPSQTQKPSNNDDAGIKLPPRPQNTDNSAVADNTVKRRPTLEDAVPPAAKTETTTKPAETAKTAPAAPAAAPAGNVPTAKLLADASLAMKTDLPRAEMLCAQATKQDPKNARAWQLYANVSEKQGKLALAASYAEKSCAISKTAACYVYLGTLQGKAGMTDESQDSFKKALEIDPNNAQAKSKLK